MNMEWNMRRNGCRMKMQFNPSSHSGLKNYIGIFDQWLKPLAIDLSPFGTKFNNVPTNKQTNSVPKGQRLIAVGFHRWNTRNVPKGQRLIASGFNRWNTRNVPKGQRLIAVGFHRWNTRNVPKGQRLIASGFNRWNHNVLFLPSPEGATVSGDSLEHSGLTQDQLAK